jgi:PAS domain S-box-containing protein
VGVPDEALPDDSELFRLLVEGVTDYAILMLDPEGTIVSWNSGAQRIKGYTAQEALGHHFSIFYTPEALARDLPARELMIAQRDGRYEEEGWRLRKDGTTFWASVVITALRDDHGGLRGFAKVTRDMSQRRVAQELEREGKEAAERASRIKSEFLSGMSHELRTPLNVVLGFAQLLGLDDLEPHQREAVDQITKSGELLLRLVGELLDLSRIEADRMMVSLEPVHIGTLIRGCIHLAAPIAAERNVRIVAPPRLEANVYALADQQRLQQVVMNLLSNAIKYNRDEGIVRIEVSVDGDRVRVSVADTGEGLDPDSMDLRFVPFERLVAPDSRIVGSGLGLALSKRLVELMNGTITVDSTPGAGSTFHISLPRADGPDLDRVDDDKAAAATFTTVLYIEDNIANLQLVERVLERVGDVEVLSAVQGRLGLELARTHRPDLILLDIHLPDMSGEDVAKALRTDDATREIPIVVLSADAYSSQRQRMLTLGVNAYMTKPFNVPELIALIKDLVGE